MHVTFLLTKVAGMTVRRQAAMMEAIETVMTVKIVVVGLVAVMAGVVAEVAETARMVIVIKATNHRG